MLTNDILYSTARSYIAHRRHGQTHRIDGPAYIKRFNEYWQLRWHQ